MVKALSVDEKAKKGSPVAKDTTTRAPAAKKAVVKKAVAKKAAKPVVAVKKAPKPLHPTKEAGATIAPVKKRVAKAAKPVESVEELVVELVVLEVAAEEPASHVVIGAWHRPAKVPKPWKAR